MANGSTFRANASTLTGVTYSVFCQSNGSANTIYFGGQCVLNKRIYVNEVSKNNLYGYSTYGAYSGSNALIFEFATMPALSTTFLNFAQGTSLTKFSIYNLPSYLEIYTNTPTTLALRYKTFTISSSLSNLTMSGNNTADMGSNYVATLTPSDATLYALPTNITITDDNWTTFVSGTQYTYNSSTGVITIFKDYITSNLLIEATASLTTKGIAYQFIDTNMHMNDYDPTLSGNGSGYCSDASHHYYATAKTEFNALSDEAKTEFMTSSDTKIVAARNRLEAWAHANGEEISYVDDAYVLRSSTAISSYANKDNIFNYAIIFIVIAMSLLIPSIIILIVYKKKHQ